MDDIDQNLLLQFSCMGTSDKDELVKQFQTLVGYQINTTAACFFLEMNNWNLQGALGSYFDAHAIKLPSMSLVRDFSIAEREACVLPGSTFVKCCEVQNTGDEAWPPDCRLEFTGGCMMMVSGRLPVGSLPPYCRATLRLDMTAPDHPGIYESKWRMSTSSGSYFGDVIWVIITVSNDATPGGPSIDQSLNGLAEQLSTLTPLGTSIVPFSSNTYTSSQPKSQSDSQTSMDEDGNMMC